MRVLIADEFEQSGRDELARLGCEVRFAPKLKDEALVADVEQFRPDVLVVRGTKVPEAVLAAGALKLVVRAGAGYNTIDVAAASRRGIYVSNCPGKNSIAVAELAFGLILALDRQIPDNVIALRQGQWNKSAFSKARGLYGRTLGLIGLGQIGREVALRAKAFGLPVVAWSRSLTADAARQLGVQRMDSPVAVASASDIVSLHVALNAQTKGLIDALFFAAMRPGAYFINTARAEVVDQVALARAIRAKGHPRRPGRLRRRTHRRHRRIRRRVSPNSPASTARTTSAHPPSRRRRPSRAETVRIIRTFLQTGKVPNVVNLARTTPATCALVVRHLDRPGVLAGVLDAIRAAEINVQEMENIIFEGAQAAVARIHLETAPGPEVIARIQSSSPHILEVSLITL